MSLRAVLVTALVAGVAMPAATLDATAHAETTTKKKANPSRSKQKAKAKAKAKKRAKAKKATASRTKRTKRSKRAKAKQVGRKPTKSSLAVLKNMPRGYAWPPTKQMEVAERACEAELDAAGVSWKRTKGEGRIVSPMTVTSADGAMVLGGITYTSAWRKAPHKLDCQLALALERFGPELHAIGVREVKFGSIYRWTNVRVNGQNRNMLSRHALGIAMDIVSFTDASGREINVEKDYPNDDPVLLGVEAAVNSSKAFRVLLTPRNDPRSHHDHFHLEVAVDYTAGAAVARKP